MAAEDPFAAPAQACIANHEEILRHGSPERRMASRRLLYALADAIRRRGEEAAVRERHGA
ncbi:MAG: hypothetical protein INR70_10920 [Parafilimonas terrae]|jgi:hypothetical protein|nr:hypothetical protein [Parafilimonas terrae]